MAGRAKTPGDGLGYIGVSHDSYIATPSDSVDLPRYGRCFAVFGDAGPVSFRNGAGRTVVLPSVPNGAYVLSEVTRIHDSGTDATGILVLP